MKQFRSIFIIAAQTALLSCANSLCASTSTCDIDWSDVIGLRVDVPNGCCPVDNPSCERIFVEPMSDNANLQGGSECGEYVLAVTVKGRVEDQDDGFDYVYVNGTLFFSGRDNDAGCEMHPAEETRQITVKADDPIVLTYDRVDNFYNDGAYAEITKISLISGPGCNDGACSTCGGAGGGSAGNSSVDVRVSLGDAERGLYPGMFRVKTESPDPSIYTTAAIEYGVDIDADVEEIRDGNEAIRQVLTSQVLADVVTLSARKYEIRFYYAADAGSQSGGLYQPTGTPYKVWTFEDPDNGAGSNYRLKVTESSDGSDTVHEYTWIPANEDWTLVSGGLKEIGRAESTVGSDRVETYWVKAPGGSDTYRRETTYQTFAWGEEKVAETLDPQNPSGGRTTTWTYYTDEPGDGANYSKLKLMEQPDGYWERYEYDSDGRTIKTVSPAGNSTPADSESLSRVVEWTYETTAPQVTRVERYQGQEVERRYTVYDGDITQEILAATPGAPWDATGNLVTETELVGGSEEFSDRVAYTRYSDGTMRHSTYSRDAGTGELTTTTTRGAPDAGETAVIEGRRTITVEDAYGKLISETIEDIASGLTLSFKFVTSADELGRPLRIDYLDGTFETFVYSCCGLSTHTDREGIVTSYFHDALKRKRQEVRNGVTHEHVFDASDRIIEEARIGTDASRMVLSAAAYSADGRILWEQDALGFKRNYSYGSTAAGGKTVTITHEADSSTRIRSYLRDGRLVEVGGTAAAPRKYTYGTEVDGSTWEQEIRIGTGGSETEWVKTYENMLSQNIRMEYPDAAETTYGYNDLGQLVRQTDADGVQTLFAYNATGQQTVRAVDLNRNGVIDYAGADRIERSSTEVVDVAGSTLIRETSERWESNGTDTPTTYAVIELSADGLQTTRTVNGQPEQSTVTYDGAGGRIEAAISPEGVTTIREYAQGELIESKTLDANDQLITRTTYLYDPHRRLQSATLDGVGATTYTYTDDDQIATITSRDPDPAQTGGGFDPQLTQYGYNDRGWQTLVTHPDGAETHTSYYPTGKIKRTWGARTYPVEYEYDPQQRLTRMKTWKDFTTESGSALTRWTYDPQRGWLNAKIYDDDHGPTYTYTDAGRLLTRAWARGITTTYGYEDGGEIDAISYSDATPPVTYTHLRTGEIETVADAAGLLTLTRSNDHVLGEAYSGSGILSGKSLTRDVDAYNRIDSLTATSIVAHSMTYDDASRLGTVTQGDHVATYAYADALGVIEQVRIETSGTERSRLHREHDQLARVTRTDTLGNETMLHARRDYLHNNANQRTSVTEENGRKWSFDYDSLGQVIQAEKLESGSEEVLPGYAFGYTFDDIGNRTQTVVNERSVAYTSDALNQYIQRDYPGAVDVRGHAPEHVGVIVNSEPTERNEGDYYAPANGDNSTGPIELDIVVKALDPGPPELLAEESRTALLPQDPESFTHDLDGNLTQDGLWTYEWDAENRLIAMESRTDLPASVVRQRLEFAYDSRSRRIEKTVKEYDSGTSSWTTKEQIRFLYDDWNLIAEYDALDSDVLTRSHAWGLDLSGTPQGAGGVGGLLWSSQSGADYAPGFDGNGNIIAWVDLSDGTLAGTSEYEAFGETLTSSGISAEMPFGFSTKYEDSETELLYYGYRFYSPSTGRWLSRDPIEERGGLNLYAIVGNNPVNYIDFLGMEACETEWEIDIVTIEMVTTLATGRTATIQDPESVIRGYVTDRVKDRAKEAAEKRSTFLRILKEAQGTARSLLGRVGFVAEGMLSHGLVIDSISMDVEFKCCKCDGDGNFNWEKMSASSSRDNLLLMLRLQSDRQRVPGEYVRVMTGAANSVVNQCEAPDDE